MAGHSRLAASASSRWIRCPGSVAYIEFLKSEKKIPEESSNAAANLGTAVHTLIEKCIIDARSPANMSIAQASKIAGMPLQQKNLEDAQLCYDLAVDLSHGHAEVFAERQYDLSFVYNAELGGTADISAFETNGLLTIADYKNGRTVVEAENNSQMRIYALGGYHHENDWYDFKQVQTIIVQPNAPHRNGKIRSETIPVTELLSWEENVLVPAVDKIKNKTATLIPGAIQCQWCEARHLCEANAKQTLSLAQIDFANVADPKPDLPAPSSLTEEQLGFILDNKERLLAFLSKCEQHVYDTISHTNREFADWTLEDKFGNRKIKDEDTMKAAIKKNRLTIKEFYVEQKPKLMTITQMESHLKKDKHWDKTKVKEFMDEITERPLTGKQLTKVHCDAEQDFQKLETKKPSGPRKKSKLTK